MSEYDENIPQQNSSSDLVSPLLAKASYRLLFCVETGFYCIAQVGLKSVILLSPPPRY